jgi:hypothetical protein
MKRKNMTPVDPSLYSKRSRLQEKGSTSQAEISVQRSTISSKASVKNGINVKMPKVGFGPSLDQNLKKIIENEKNLQNENTNLLSLTQESKIQILDEFVRKNFDLTEMDEMLEEMKELEKLAFELHEKNNGQRIYSLAESEYIKTSLETSRNVKYQLTSELAQKNAEAQILDDEIIQEELNVKYIIE